MTFDDVIDLNDTQQRRDLLEDLDEARGLHKIVIEERQFDRTDQQNKAYWALIIRRVTRKLKKNYPETPWTEYGVHLEFRHRFLSDDRRIVNDQGEVDGFHHVTSTTKLSKRRFSEYFDDCRNWAQKYLDLFIPDPDPEWYLRPEEREDSDEETP